MKRQMFVPQLKKTFQSKIVHICLHRKFISVKVSILRKLSKIKKASVALPHTPVVANPFAEEAYFLLRGMHSPDHSVA